MSAWLAGFCGFYGGFYSDTQVIRSAGIEESRPSAFNSIVICAGIALYSSNSYIQASMIGFIFGVLASQLAHMGGEPHRQDTLRLR